MESYLEFALKSRYSFETFLDSFYIKLPFPKALKCVTFVINTAFVNNQIYFISLSVDEVSSSLDNTYFCFVPKQNVLLHSPKVCFFTNIHVYRHYICPYCYLQTCVLTVNVSINEKYRVYIDR